MMRVPMRSRDDLPEEGRRVYDEIVKTRGEVDEAFQILLDSPEALRRIAHLGSYIRFESRLSGAIRECIILATARECGSEFEWASHEPQARRAGVSEDTIRSIKSGEVPAHGSAEERAALQFAFENLRDHRISDATFEKTRAVFGIGRTTDIAATVGFYAMLASILNAFDVAK